MLNIVARAASGRAIRALGRGMTISSLVGLNVEKPMFVCSRVGLFLYFEQPLFRAFLTLASALPVAVRSCGGLDGAGCSTTRFTMLRIAALMTYNQNADLLHFRAIDDGVRKVDERKRLTALPGGRADAWAMLQEPHDSFEFVQKTSRDGDAGLPSVEPGRVREIVCSKAMDRFTSLQFGSELFQDAIRRNHKGRVVLCQLFPVRGDCVPCLVAGRIGIQTCHNTIKQAGSVGSGKAENLRLKGFQWCIHGVSAGFGGLAAHSLPQVQGRPAAPSPRSRSS